ncbi:F0F1 ATP synthase subunit alpha [candidate division TM6 bacterium RIFCSPHIGHO2_12_FULL_38_8]|nr:MAG: F0F1 ATP synthase subunit alpha [candidate division TM6 bacterium RIFCSPHIGHO2_12_FULL_38_8]
MNTRDMELVSLLQKELQDKPAKQLDQVGIVVQVGDGICKIYGLVDAVYAEVVAFEGGNKGIILNMSEDFVLIFVLSQSIPVSEGEVVKRTGQALKISVGESMLGRVINALGEPIDGLGEILTTEFRAVEQDCPSIVDRTPISQPLQTGILAIDALVPIGKGQRELIVGNRNTGKTALAIDVILNQKDKDVICIYVSIGQRQGNLARLVSKLEEHGALEYTVVMSADSSEAVLNQYLAPYAGTTLAEHFMYQGKDVLIVYDDLTNHAVAYREMSLLMRRAPGREAYPGDVFYLHSRLLERSACLKAGGSITCLPIIQIQEDDITAYIPTNLISITDGQLFLDAQLFKQGVRPAVSVELSVSRVGGAAQTLAVKKMSKALRLELAQYHELLSFAQFGTELDEISQRHLNRGALAVEILKQEQYLHYSFIDEAIILFMLRQNVLDAIALKEISSFVVKATSYVKSVYPDLYQEIAKTKDITDKVAEKLKMATSEFAQLFKAGQ